LFLDQLAFDMQHLLELQLYQRNRIMNLGPTFYPARIVCVSPLKSKWLYEGADSELLINHIKRFSLWYDAIYTRWCGTCARER
jgi:hypothetical protein